MQLGLADVSLAAESKTKAIYNSDTIAERHRHRYGFNPKYVSNIELAGLEAVGVNPELKALVELWSQRIIHGLLVVNIIQSFCLHHEDLIHYSTHWLNIYCQLKKEVSYVINIYYGALCHRV